MTTGYLLYNSYTERYEIEDIELHCGDCFEVRLDRCDEWIETRIEMNKNGWYLVGLPNELLHGGLEARVKWG